MGFAVMLESDPYQRCPFWFESSDSKLLAEGLLFTVMPEYGEDVFGPIAETLGVSADPIIGSGEEGFNWCPIDEFIECLEALDSALQSGVSKFESHSNLYLSQGWVAKDISDVLKMARWHKAEGAERLRFVVE